ncbi:MAG TPA: hypothetical protein DIT07_15285 [Sphingobacteriaceae bacterium]|nr:hypothetical protein [Sphingobacteriaceae bacterium]
MAAVYKTKLSFLLFFIVLAHFSCSPLIASFDQYSYVQTTSLKVEALALMDKAAEPFNRHEAEAKDLRLSMDKLYEYELHKPKNVITTKMWFKIKDPNAHLMGYFIKRWENEGKLNPFYIEELKPIMEQAFDQVAELESKKIKESEVSGSIFKF